MSEAICPEHGPQSITAMGASGCVLSCGARGSSDTTWTHPQLVARGDLTPEQVTRLDEVLAHHNLPASSPHSTPERLAYACLECGSIGESESREARDSFIDNFDPTCCGVTVIFHSSHRVLVDPSTLGAPRQIEG